MKTTTTWRSAHQFTAEQRGTTIQIDANNGFSPKALLLAGLAGCSGVDVVDILEKMRVPFASLVIEAEAEQTEEPPKVFKTIHLTFQVIAEEEVREKIVKAIELSLEKYCGVAAMLKKNSAIEYTLQLKPEA